MYAPAFFDTDFVICSPFPLQTSSPDFSPFLTIIAHRCTVQSQLQKVQHGSAKFMVMNMQDVFVSHPTSFGLACYEAEWPNMVLVKCRIDILFGASFSWSWSAGSRMAATRKACVHFRPLLRYFIIGYANYPIWENTLRVSWLSDTVVLLPEKPCSTSTLAIR